VRDLKVCIAARLGGPVARSCAGVLDAPDLELRAAVARSAAGRDLGERSAGRAGRPVYGAVREALDGVDVLIDYTGAGVVKANALAAIEAGAAVVIGTSGLTARRLRRDRGGGARALGRRRRVGNFSLTAAMCQAARCSRPATCRRGR
jgi:4-hydroxy-tetrahydrodipicolinate reductase